MFRAAIPKTVFTSEAAGALMEKIMGSAYSGDVSFLSSLRALIFPRMSEGDELSLTFNVFPAGTDNSASRIARDIDTPTPNQLQVVNIYGDADSVNAAITALEKDGESVFTGFTRLDKITDFFRKAMSVVAFANSADKRTYVFVANMDQRKNHYLQTAILPLLPWYFDAEKGVTAEEMALIQSLREKTPDKYLSALSALAAHYDFRKAMIESKLRGFEKTYERNKLDRLERELSEIDSAVDTLQAQIGNYMIKRRDSVIMIAGLRSRIEDGTSDSELMEYFLCNKGLYLEEVRDTQVYFVVFGPAAYYDSDNASAILRRGSMISGVYRDINKPKVKPEDMEHLIQAIFVDEKLKLMMCAAYRLDMMSGAAAVEGYDFPAELAEYLPNPHIDRYSCLGNYRQVINEMIRAGDYVGATEQCVASARSLNWSDSTVMRELLRQLFSTEKHCIELPDGIRATPVEAVEFLKKESSHVEEEA